MKSKERSLALSCLLRVLYGGAYSNILVDKVLKNDLKERQSAAFFTKLFMGTLEKIPMLDEIIKNHSNKKLKDIERKVLCILRLSVYQMYFMDSVPDRAAISSSLSLLEEEKLSRAKGFVNGILGSISRGERRVPDMPAMPGWLYDYIIKSAEDEAAEAAGAYSEEGDHRLCLRINRDKISAEEALSLLDGAGLNYDLNSEAEDAVILARGIGASEIPGLDKGIFYIQDLTSQKAVLAAGISPGDRVMDLCAAPGGKGLYAAFLTGKEGFVSMRDISENKVRLIKKNMERAGAKNCEVKEWDACILDEDWEEKADVVICDLPCSGLGTIKNKPEIKYRINIEDIGFLSKLQRSILKTAAAYVKPGGRLLYSTCTVSHLENQDNADFFKESFREFFQVKRCLTLPDKTGGDGFFYAVFERKL